MQNESVIRRSRKKHSDFRQFCWWEKTSDGTRIYRRREIGTVDRIPDLETARKAASLLVPDLNARKARSELASMTIAKLSAILSNANCVWLIRGEATQPSTSTRSTSDDGSFQDGVNRA